MKTRQGWYKQHHHFHSILRQGTTTSWRIHRPILMVHSLVTQLPILTSKLNLNNVAHLTCASWCGWKSNSWSDCCFTGKRTLLTMLTIILQTTTLQHKIGHSYYYTQFNSHAHPFTYYLSRKQQNMLPNKLK